MSERAVVSELNAKVWAIEVGEGDQVETDDTLIVLEAMKTEIPVVAPCPGTVKAIFVAKDDVVSEGQALVMLAV